MAFFGAWVALAPALKCEYLVGSMSTRAPFDPGQFLQQNLSSDKMTRVERKLRQSALNIQASLHRVEQSRILLDGDHVPYEKKLYDFCPKNIQLKNTTKILRFLYDLPCNKRAKFCNKSHRNHTEENVWFFDQKSSNFRQI